MYSFDSDSLQFIVETLRWCLVVDRFLTSGYRYDVVTRETVKQRTKGFTLRPTKKTRDRSTKYKCVIRHRKVSVDRHNSNVPLTPSLLSPHLDRSNFDALNNGSTKTFTGSPS